MITGSDLNNPPTFEEILADKIAELEENGFPASSWDDGDIRKTLLALDAENFAVLLAIAKNLKDLVLLEEGATGDLLTETADQHYDVDRGQPTQAQGLITVKNEGAAPISLVTGDLIIENVDLGQFENAGSIALGAGASGSFTFRAIVSGSQANGGNNQDWSVSSGPPSLTITNPPQNDGTSWLTSAGTDEQSDQSLIIECTSKWGTLSIERPEDAYVNLAHKSGFSKAAVRADNPDGPFTVAIYIAKETGPASASEVSNFQLEIDQFKAPRSITTVHAAPEIAIDVRGRVYVRGLTSDKVDAVKDAIIALFNETDLGGVEISGGYAFRFSELIAAITTVPSVVSVQLSSPVKDVIGQKETLFSIFDLSFAGLTFINAV